MKKLAKKLVLVISIAVFALLSGCSTTAYEAGVKGNQDNYKLYSDIYLAQQNTIQECFKSAVADKSQCAILAAGANGLVLGARPTEIRVAASPGEIAKEIASKGFDAAALVYGLKAVGKAVEAAVKDPLVVRPEIVNPVIVGP